MRFVIGKRLKQVLDLEASTLIEYKHHEVAMQDMSTFRFVPLTLFGLPIMNAFVKFVITIVISEGYSYASLLSDSASNCRGSWSRTR